jgi:GR25 family glycosyltransferase involved in LPS biosynthesis
MIFDENGNQTIKSLCLNLRSRPDRWELAKKEFEKQSLTVERFFAIEHENPIESLDLSFIGILKSIEEPTLVFEDDVIFVNNKIEEVLSTAPQDWDILYLSGDVMNKLKHEKDHWWRCLGTSTAHSIIFKPSAAKYILSKYTKKYEIFDIFLREEIQPVLKCYICKPFITTQRNGYSDVWKSYIEDKYEILMSQKNLKD